MIVIGGIEDFGRPKAPRPKLIVGLHLSMYIAYRFGDWLQSIGGAYSLEPLQYCLEISGTR